MEGIPNSVCPVLQAECMGIECAWYQDQMTKTLPGGEPEGSCSIRLIPFLLGAPQPEGPQILTPN